MKAINRAGQYDNFIQPSDSVQSRGLTAGVAEAVTVPAGANNVFFESTAVFWVNWTTTATVPADVTDGSASEQWPLARYIGGVSSFSIISNTSAIVSMSFYS